MRKYRPQNRAQQIALFFSHVRVTSNPDECWEWQANRIHGGYGHFSLDGRTVKAHRFAYALAYGSAPDGIFVCHRRDNPPCCNPAHLFAGTPQDNTADKLAKGRGADRQGEKHPLAWLTEDQVRQIKTMVAMGRRHADIAEQFGVSRQHIGKIARGESWGHVNVQ